MNKEELLSKIREKNEGNDPFEAEVSSFSWKAGAIFALALSFLICYLEWIVWDVHNFGLFLVTSSLLSVSYAIKAIRLKHKPYIVCAAIYSLIFIVSLVVYVIAFLDGWL